MAKIYVESFHFQARRDTEENWSESNPVLCDGEFAIITDGADGEWLKVGNGVTEWRNLPYRKGPKGDRGEKGDKGEKGEPALTDSEYNPESENAQSGRAVAQAISAAMEENVNEVNRVLSELVIVKEEEAE